MTRTRTASRLARILAMLPWVIANPGSTVAEVSRRFGYQDEGDLARDLDMVFVCGLPGYGPGDLMVAYIEDDEVVVDTADYFEHAPRLTAGETLSTLASAMAIIASGQGSPALESAVDKLAATVAPDTDSALNVDLAGEPDLVATLRAAAAERRVINLTYTALSRGETTQRDVEPWSVFASLGNWYLRGYCRLAQAERIFRVDRIRQVTETDQTFEAPATVPDPEVNYVPSADDVRAVIDLTPEALWVLDYYPVEVLEEEPGRTRIEFSAGDPAVVARLLLRLGSRARLVEGTEVREAREDLGTRVLARYQ